MKDVKKYNLGMMGSGKIAEVIVKALPSIENSVVKYGVSSRNVLNAKRFKEKFNFIHYFDTYEDMLNDEKIDIVYISTPTKLHYEHICMCLVHDKHVICEKPFVESYNQAIELFDLAKKKNLLIIGGLWSAYMPFQKKLNDIIDNKYIGEIKSVCADLGYPSLDKNAENVVSKYDIFDYEIYPLVFCLMIFGNDYIIDKTVSKKKKEHIIESIVYLKFLDKKARIHSSLVRRTTYSLFVKGTKGFIYSRKYWFGNKSIFMYRKPFKFSRIHFSHEYNGYEYELKEMVDCLDTYKMESKTYPHSSTLSIMKLIDDIKEKDK